MPGLGHESVATGYLDHMCRVSKSLCFGLGNVFFGGWLGNNLPGLGHELVSTSHLDRQCRFLKAWSFGLRNVVFVGWLGDHQNFIFINTIDTWYCNNLPGLGHELMEIGYLDQICLFSETCWFQVSTWWFPKVYHLKHHCTGRKFNTDGIYGRHFWWACQL